MKIRYETLLLYLVSSVAFLFLIKFVSFDSKLRDEYALAQALGRVQIYLENNNGTWPSSAKELYEENEVPDSVYIDYSVTSSELVLSQELLENSIRLKEGDVESYPHFERDIQRIYETLKKFDSANE